MTKFQGLSDIITWNPHAKRWERRTPGGRTLRAVLEDAEEAAEWVMELGQDPIPEGLEKIVTRLKRERAERAARRKAERKEEREKFRASLSEDERAEFDECKTIDDVLVWLKKKREKDLD